jgi:uncharacterized membrane protein
VYDGGTVTTFLHFAMAKPTSPAPGPAVAPAPAPHRFAALDAARGVALLAMALYHLVWDAGFLRLTPENAALSPLGRAAAHGIAGSFLVLVGLSLVLERSRSGSWRPYLRRLGRIAGAAALISLATRVIFPDAWIFFGILHCIALSSVLALPALRIPLPATILAAALVLAAPTLTRLGGETPALLDAPALLFLGLGSRMPVTNDYVPLVPWFGLVLAGVAIGRLAWPRIAHSPVGTWRPRHRPGRLAAAAGRHSLAIYLVHQPVLLGILYAVAALTGPHPRAGQAQFLRDYRETCRQAGGTDEACRVAARCLLVRLREDGLWQEAQRDAFTPADRERAVAQSQRCFSAAGGR